MNAGLVESDISRGSQLMESTNKELTVQRMRTKDVVEAAKVWREERSEHYDKIKTHMDGFDVDLTCAVWALTKDEKLEPTAKELPGQLDMMKAVVEAAKVFAEGAERRFIRSRVLQVPLSSADIGLCLAVRSLKKGKLPLVV